MITGEDFAKLAENVLGTWTKQRKRENRNPHQVKRRVRAFAPRVNQRRTVKDVAYEHMKEAYMKASGNGRRPAHARQIMYACRPWILKEAEGVDGMPIETLDDKYFTQKLLPEYMEEHPGETAHWDVVFDARGHFEEPHTKVIVPLGTLHVRDYLQRAPKYRENIRFAPQALYTTHGPKHRFGAVLFIEKEGFLPLFESAKLAERYDIAIMSTKGMSVTAARKLVDQVCGPNGIPLLILHDFDKSGFSILGTLRRDTRRYQFGYPFERIDLGLRLADVQELNLESEPATHGGRDANLRRNGATAQEIAFLRDQRVELNAMTSDQLLEWLEAKLKQHGIKKIVPDEATLETAFRRAVKRRYVADKLKDIQKDADKKAEEANPPSNLKRKIEKRLKSDPALPWDKALAAIVAKLE